MSKKPESPLCIDVALRMSVLNKVATLNRIGFQDAKEREASLLESGRQWKKSCVGKNKDNYGLKKVINM